MHQYCHNMCVNTRAMWSEKYGTVLVCNVKAIHIIFIACISKMNLQKLNICMEYEHGYLCISMFILILVPRYIQRSIMYLEQIQSQKVQFVANVPFGYFYNARAI